MPTKKPAKKSSSSKDVSLAPAMDFDPTDYHVKELARKTVLNHPAVQKRLAKVEARLTRTVNGHGGMTAMRAEEPVPKTAGAAPKEPKLKGPAQTVSARMPRQDKLPKPKPKTRGSKTSY